MIKKSLYMVLVLMIISSSLISAGNRGTILKGKIRDSGSKEFVSGLKILLMGDVKNHTTKTDTNGYFRISGLNKNRFYTLNVYKNSRLICSKRIKVVNDKEYISLSLNIYGQKELYVASSVNLTGKIIDSKTLMPIHRAYVFLDGGEIFTISDKNGRYFFEDVASGFHVIKVRSRNHDEQIREIKLKKKEEYMDFELGMPVKDDNTYVASQRSEIPIEMDLDDNGSYVSENENSQEDYINEDLLEVGFDEAVKKVVSLKQTKSVKTGSKAQSDFATLAKRNDNAPTLLGPTGLIDISSAETLSSGQVNFGVGVFSGNRDTLAGEIDTSLSAFKLIYGLKDSVEVGVSNLQKEYDRYFDDNNSQLFHVKYNVDSTGPFQMAFGYSYLNDDVIVNSNILNFITQYSFRTGKFHNNLIMNVSTSTDFSDSVNSFVNIGLESKPLFIRYPLSYMIELEQNEDKEFKILNIGLRLKKNPSFDLVYRKELDSSNQMLGLGSNVRF